MKVFPNKRKLEVAITNERRKDRLENNIKTNQEYKTYYSILFMCITMVFLLLILATFGGYSK